MHLALAVFVATHSAVAVLAILAGAAVLGSVLTYTGTGGGAMDQNLGTFGPYVDQELAGIESHSATGAGIINFTHGKVVITAAGVAALTLAAPVAGSPASGGNDGQELKILDQSGHAHTVTTSSNEINGNHHVLTSGGSAGDSVTLTAYNGVWYCNPAGTNWTVS
jgi:hypothetical protein